MNRAERFYKYAARLSPTAPNPGGAVRVELKGDPRLDGMTVIGHANPEADTLLIEVTTPSGARLGRARWRSTRQEWDIEPMHGTLFRVMSELVAAIEREDA